MPKRKTVIFPKFRSHVIGITGGFGAGKSIVSRAIVSKNYPVILSDALAREVIASDNSIQQKIRRAFGDQVFDRNNILQKKALAEIVFADADRLRTLNAIVHPVVLRVMKEKIQTLCTQGQKLIFVESALIYEAEIEKMFDYIIAVTAPVENILRRISRRDGSTFDEIHERLAQQMPSEDKATRADFVIRNETTQTDLKKNTYFILSLIENLCHVD